MRKGIWTLALGVIVVAATVAARAINPLTAIGDVKSDEATYISMALSLADDGNLTFEKADLDRFLKIYPRGPEGIFLKRQYSVRPHLAAAWRPIQLTSTAVPTTAHLAYGKSIVYPLVAWPFVLLGGVGGLLVLNLVLLGICTACAIRFCQARMGRWSGTVLGLIFLGASVVPVYPAFLMPEMINVTLVFVAYFLWFYKEVAPASAWRGWHGRWTDFLAAALLGVAVYSKPTHILLVAAPVVAWFIARRFRHAIAVGALAAVVTGLFFGAQIWITGEWNYQGAATLDGRKEFYDAFPFDAKGTTYDAYATHEAVTNDFGNRDTTTSDVFFRLLPRNLWYFLAGRDAGLLPFFFPGLAITVAWLARPRRMQPWQISIFGAFVASVLTFVIIAPYSWNGGGGPPGNRYFLSTYPALLFLTPDGAGLLLPIVAAVGGLLFTGRLVMSPLVEATEPYLAVGRAPLNWLPVEIPLVNDLPVSLRGERYFRIEVVHEPFVVFYYLDAEPNFWEGDGLWTRGHGTTDILIRTEDPITKLTLKLTDKYVANNVAVTIEGISLFGETERAHLEPGGTATLVFKPRPGFWHHASYGIVLHVSTSSGFVPAAIGENPAPGQPPDTRNLGVYLQPVFEIAERLPNG